GCRSRGRGCYPGPLLPASRAPAVVRLRRRLADGLRAALVAGADPDLLADWVHAPWGEDDVEVWRALAAARPTPSHRARLAALESELAAPGGWAGREDG
ncbi:transcriptional regulator, partial [Streptomyces fungicidicus]